MAHQIPATELPRGDPEAYSLKYAKVNEAKTQS
jgi:hypothetical protein